MPRRKKTEEPIEQIRSIKTPALIRGMKDILPGDSKYWRKLLDNSHQFAKDQNFIWIDTPVLEKHDLFASAIGRNHFFVKKDLISFLDKNEKITLRPDFIPGVARSFIEHSLYNQTPPTKLWYSGKIYTQGNYYQTKHRELHQVGYSVFNVDSSDVDAELVVMLYQLFTELGLKPYVKVNNLGDLTCRGEYAKALTGYIKSKRAAVCAECRSVSTKNPLKFLSCVNQKCSRHLDEAPQLVDYLSEDCHNHLFKFLESLDEVGVNYEMDNYLIHDFAYYNSTIYSIYNKSNEEGEDVLLAHGGRFNYLCEMLGGPDVKASGINFVVEKIISEIKREKIELPAGHVPHIYLAQLSEQGKRAGMSFLAELRKEDLRVVANFSKDSLKSQLDTAQKMNAKIILILGQREVVDGTIIMRDVETGIQEVVSIKKVIGEVKKLLWDKEIKKK